AYYSLLVYATYFVARLVHSWEHKRRSLLPVLQFTLAVVLGIGVAAIQWVPTYQLSTHSQRTGGVSFEYATTNSYDPADIKNFVSPYANGDGGNSTYTGKSIFWEDYGYIGLVPLILAIGAALVFWRVWSVRFFAFMALIS